MVIITANEGTETRRLSEKEENVSNLQVAVGFSFTSDWLRGLILDIFFSITAYLCGVAIELVAVQQVNRFAYTLGNSEEFKWGNVKIFLHQEPPHVQKILRRLCIFLSGILLGPKTNLKTSNQAKYK